MTRKLSRAKVTGLDKAAEIIDRAKADAAISKQPRFGADAKNARQLFYDIYNFGKNVIFEEPKYVADSRKRDAWLALAVTKEPYMLGVLQSMVSIDRNRGWTLIGGRNQVNKFTAILHNFQVAPDLYGWRPGLGVSALSYYRSDLGAPVEVGRLDIGKDKDGNQVPGPLAKLYTVDPTKCRLTGNLEFPLKYQSAKAGMQDWGPRDYFRVTSFPDNSENMSGLGYCFASRAIEIAKLMVAVFEHYREKLGSKAPKGILTINGGITLTQWLESLEESKAELSSLEREYYAGVQVLVGGRDDPIDVKLTGLSDLPDSFDYQTFVNMVMFGYALAAGYDPREFWPVSGGSLGTGKETETQHRKATSKGGLDFALGFQEKLQEELPPTIDFEFEQRDVEGDALEIALNKAKWEIIDGMYKSMNANREPLITHGQAMQLLVEAQLVPEDWTIPEEDVKATDTDDMGDVLERARVQAAMEKYPHEDIVRYSFSAGKTTVIRKAGAGRRFVMRVAKPGDDGTIPASGMGAKMTSDYVKEIIRTRREEIKARAGGDFDTIRQTYWEAVYNAVSSYLYSGSPVTSFRGAMQRAVADAIIDAVERGYQDGGGELPLEGDVNEWLNTEQASELANVGSLFSSLAMLRKEDDTDPVQEGFDRAEGYTNTLDGVYNQAVLYGMKNRMLTFDGDDGKESCADCQRLKGQRHKASWWIAHDYVPPSGDGLECAPGGHCQHGLFTDDGEQVTV